MKYLKNRLTICGAIRIGFSIRAFILCHRVIEESLMECTVEFLVDLGKCTLMISGGISFLRVLLRRSEWIFLQRSLIDLDTVDVIRAHVSKAL